MQPPSFDDLTVRGDSTTGRLAMPPIPSPSRSRQRAATAAATCLMDIGRDDDNGGTANDRAEQPPAQIQQLDRRPPWTRQPHPHLPGARIASMPLSDSDTEPPAPRPGSPAQPAARPFGPLGPLRHPPPPPQPRLVPLPDPEQPQRGATAAAAAAPAPAAGAAPRARPRRPRTAWTIEEEEALERAMEEFADCPTSWAEILRRHGQPGGPLARFDQVQLKDKARNIKTKRRKAGLPLGVFECATDYPNGL
ncbi:hypothetical protein BCR44DRAFT_391896 [Catenaria anguillulae PL171]|uniref:Myb-like domain-containing protein n=1 Tax=Catenaria anguillulae PL171 TaxID=765915 RepID=A0A1Y2HTZ7_9FUNG|nr:hypothetical protein BCR44DRAFT_391896 [Catenaria anguillulae PL171]